MSDSIANLRRKISSAGELRSVVRTMKTLAAASIGDYEKSVVASDSYYYTVQLALHACIKKTVVKASVSQRSQRHDGHSTIAIIFGSDQGLVGQFNGVIGNYAVKALAKLPTTPKIWAVGERVCAHLADAGLSPEGSFQVPSSVKSIGTLVGKILLTSRMLQKREEEVSEFYLFYNKAKSSAIYEPVSQRLLPLDEKWKRALIELPWPTKAIPEVLGDQLETLRAVIREYLFVSVYRACAESLASENSSRLAAMQRADKNIEELVDGLNSKFHRLRQGGIDEELFDVISGFEALRPSKA